MSKRFLEKYGNPLVSVGEKEVCVRVFANEADLPTQDDIDKSWVTLFSNGSPVVQVPLKIEGELVKNKKEGSKQIVLVANLPVLRLHVAKYDTAIVAKIGTLESSPVQVIIN